IGDTSTPTAGAAGDACLEERRRRLLRACALERHFGRSCGACETGPMVRLSLSLERLCGRTRAIVRCLIERVACVALNPLQRDGATDKCSIDGLEELPVEYRFAVGFAPASPLPARHPLRHRVDDVLAVTEDVQRFVACGGCVEQIE